MELVVEVYKLTKTFPAEEKYGLVSQMNRAAVSVPSNIAEGAGRGSNKDFSHFISISIGSMCELHTQLVLSERLGFIDNLQYKKYKNILTIYNEWLYRSRIN